MSYKFFNKCIYSCIKILSRMCKFLSIIKTKTDLIEMIVYGCFTEILNKKEIEDISTKEANLILDKSNITIKSLLGYGNASLK